MSWGRRMVIRVHNDEIGSGSQFPSWLVGVPPNSDVHVHIVHTRCLCPLCSFYDHAFLII
jgi:hypothetical protein